MTHGNAHGSPITFQFDKKSQTHIIKAWITKGLLKKKHTRRCYIFLSFHGKGGFLWFNRQTEYLYTLNIIHNLMLNLYQCTSFQRNGVFEFWKNATAESHCFVCYSLQYHNDKFALFLAFQYIFKRGINKPAEYFFLNSKSSNHCFNIKRWYLLLFLLLAPQKRCLQSFPSHPTHPCLGHVWSIIWGMSVACLGQHLGYIVNNGQDWTTIRGATCICDAVFRCHQR